MEKQEHIPLEKDLQKLSMAPLEAERDMQTVDKDVLSKPEVLKLGEKREHIEEHSPVDVLPEEDQHKKSVRQSDRSISSTSTCSSVAYSSPESDQVFSEEEDIQTKRKTLRKTKSWKTFFTMVHWSLRRQISWVQLAGHEAQFPPEFCRVPSQDLTASCPMSGQMAALVVCFLGNFKASERGHILKKFSAVENACLVALMEDVLRPYVPTYYGLVEREEQTYIKMEDLLMGLEAPSIMDCKIGIRTYLEDELAKALLKPTPRKDMYNKMVALDPEAPTPEERMQQAVTKPRYMQWRESVSSTASLGFRIEGVTVEAGPVKKNFKKMKSRDKIMETFILFTKGRKDILAAYLERLENMQATLQNSEFFHKHEVIGSSLLFVHDRRGFSNVWMIDFGKTTPVPSHITLRHDVPWEVGTHEDGYLLGLKNLITTLQDTMHMADETEEKASECLVPEGEKDTVSEKSSLQRETEGNTTNGENKEL